MNLHTDISTHKCILFSWLSTFVCFPCSVLCLVALAISLSSCFQINLCVSNCSLVVLQYQKICLNTHFPLAICIRNWCQNVKPLLCNFCASCCDSFFCAYRLRCPTWYSGKMFILCFYWACFLKSPLSLYTQPFDKSTASIVYRWKWRCRYRK